MKYLIFLVLFFYSGFTYSKVKNFRKESDGLICFLDQGVLKVRVCRADIIQVRYTVLGSLESDRSLVINNNFIEKASFKITETRDEIVIKTSRLNVIINKTTNAISYLTSAGKMITSEAASGNKVMTPQQVAGISTFNCSNIFNSPADEALYGLGCHPVDTGSINYKGRSQDMAIKYLTGAIPVLLSTKGFGLFWDNYAASNFYGSEAANTEFKYESESGREVNYYFFYGPGFDQIINAYRIATGKAPMFPKWSFGLFQSQDRYMSQQEILTVKDNYRNNKIPLDAIVQDWYYWDPLPIGSHVMKPERYPDPKFMVEELHKADLHAMISIWPVFGQGTSNFDALKKMGGLTDITWDNVVTHTFDTYYDAHNPKARALYWQQARDSLVKRYGWDAWWVDQCEPDNGVLLDERRKSVFSAGQGIDYFNTYSLEHTKGLYQGWRNDIPDKRAFFLVRQAFAGQQRNATTLWSSDITCTFDAFKSQVPQGINACASGIPYWTSDIGGYHLGWKAPDWSAPANQELFTRWFQFGVFCPIFRIHGKGERALFSDNWNAETKATLLSYDRLRYRLLPYIYSLAGQVTINNYTIMRALSFDFRNDPQVHSIRDQYMFGPAFLVNPVTEQLYTGAKATKNKHSRKVYLPSSANWYDFWTGEILKGGRHLTADAPLNKIPLFVRAGSIIPMGPAVQYATEPSREPLELRVYPGEDGKFSLYEDENDTYNYEKGNYSTIDIKWSDKKRVLTIMSNRGVYPGMPKQRIFNVVLVRKMHGTGGAVVSDIDKRVNYNGKTVSVNL